ncbi:3' exoribonuclease family 1 containing protein (macronuclear) [Tetrahymena thermophila SB210]|uniref:3' exoribonuclease family 1 containing protein n=1 Tax=Tetrahymena thermophila (strain SB210) TaxID=312017 RepID=I7LY60_TETTS|nr:3' exoribonuclease family 1 containing protein [Tetrahymena thermophila SB210]EAS07758.2 3' exoribonuclease family 1 containing protein [Tetrahymena thermophila SB210]|eukprot:XP_001028000.2 3' exoribonuclease family 1 containing protein [Tetrahymena thermophila SB210]
MRLKQEQLNYDDEELAREKEQNKVAIVKAPLKPCKRRRRKNKQIQWVPFLLKNNINSDSEPVYISFFKKFMRKYDNQYYNKYRNYGLIDAGYITIEQMTLDKIYGNLLVQIRNHSSGIINFQHLIDLYKSYQDQQYYELANLLDIYQTYHKNQIKHIQYYLNQEISNNNITQEDIDEVYKIFQQDAIDWAQQNYENEIYEMSLIYMNLETKTPVLKQKVFSKNLIMFITRDFYNFYSKLSCQNMKENLSLILHGDEFDGRLQLENRIKMMKQTLNGETCIQVEDEIITAEGYSDQLI